MAKDNNGKLHEITGKTQVFGVVGNPISHTLSPQIHHLIAKKMDVDLAYVPFHVKEGGLEQAIKGAIALGINGLNVTVPYKQEVLPYIKELSGVAKKINAANTLVRSGDDFIGYNTDAYGVLDVFYKHKYSIPSKSVLIIGAGGSAFATCIALAEARVRKITIANRTLENAKTLAENLKKNYNGEIEVIDLADISKTCEEVIIQTTSGGFSGGTPLDVTDEAIFKNAEFVIDIIYSPWETEFLKMARKHCKKSFNGFQMLVSQACLSFTHFTGKVISDEIANSVFNEIEQEYLQNNK